MMFARTRRLLLRPGWPEDAAALTRALADERIGRAAGTIPCPYTLADAAAWLAVPSPALPLTLPRMLIFEREPAAPTFIGGIALVDASSRPTIAFWIRPDRWGLGFATEAGEAMLAIADMLGHRAIDATYFLDNPAAVAVLRKLGFDATGVVRVCPSLARPDPALCREMRRYSGADAASSFQRNRQACQKRLVA